MDYRATPTRYTTCSSSTNPQQISRKMSFTRQTALQRARFKPIIRHQAVSSFISGETAFTKFSNGPKPVPKGIENQRGTGIAE